jgi:hypothetical protein
LAVGQGALLASAISHLVAPRTILARRYLSLTHPRMARGYATLTCMRYQVTVCLTMLWALPQSGCQAGEAQRPLASASAVASPRGGRGYSVECDASRRRPCYLEAFRQCHGDYVVASEYGDGNRFALVVECHQ